MPSSYASNTKLELMAAGENSGTWGNITNANLSVIDAAIFGFTTISPAGASSSLNTPDDGTTASVPTPANYKVLVYSGTTEAHTVTLTPNTVRKQYIVNNTTSYNLIFQQGNGAGGTVTIAAGKTKMLYCTGTGLDGSAAVVDITSTFEMDSVSITGGTITGLSSPLPIASGGTGGNDVATAQTALGVLVGTNVQAYNARLTDVSNMNVTDNYFISGDGTNLILESPSDARTSLGVAIGTDVQAYDPGLQSISILTTAADKMIYTTNSDVYAATDLTATGRSLVGAADVDAAIQVINSDITAANLSYLDVTTEGQSEASRAVTTDASGDTTFNGSLLVNGPIFSESFTENFVDNVNSGTLDCQAANIFKVVPNASSITFTFSNPPTSGNATGITIIVAPSTTVTTLNWPASVVWSNGYPPDIPASGTESVFVFFTHDGGTKWYGFLAGDDMA
jgi:hypothetical protein